jgi:hypothetical protein
MTETHRLDLVVTEKVIEYDVAIRGDWKRGNLLESFLPERERFRTKYKGQCKTYHFGEVLTMAELQRDGWCWVYENFYLFWNKTLNFSSYEAQSKWVERSRKTNAVYAGGTKELAKILGKSTMERLWKEGERYRTDQLYATEPDLLAFRKQGDGYEVKAIEVKSTPSDRLKRGQRLGLALLRNHAPCEVQVYRYVEKGTGSTPGPMGLANRFWLDRCERHLSLLCRTRLPRAKGQP